MAEIIGYFPATLAVDIATRTPLRDVQAQVYAIADTSFSAPLAITDMADVPFTGGVLTANGDGVFPEFKTPAGINQVIVKSGQALTPMTSVAGEASAVKQAASEAAAASVSARSAQELASQAATAAAAAAAAAEAVGVTNVDAVATALETAGRARQSVAVIATQVAMQTTDKGFVTTDSQRFPGLDPSGQTSSLAALRQIVDNLGPGVPLVLEGKLLLDGASTIPLSLDPTKYPVIDGRRGVLVAKTRDIAAVQAHGSYEQPFTIMNIASVLLPELGDKGARVHVLRTSEPPPWREGDKIKVVSDDVIPASHYTTATKRARLGEGARVLKVVSEGDVHRVYLQGLLEERIYWADAYTTNPRVARLVPGSVTLTDLTFDVSEDRWEAQAPGTMVRLRALDMPKVERLRFKRLAGIGISTHSCHGYVISFADSAAGINNPATGNISYMGQDASSVDGLFLGGVASGGRHFLTDGTDFIEAGSPDIHSYGASINTKAKGVTVRDMSSAGLDTHHMSLGFCFEDATVYATSEQAAFLLRGRRARIHNSKSIGGRAFVKVTTQATTVAGTVWSVGDSYGHFVTNPYSIGTLGIVEADVRANPAHTKYNQRDEEVVNLTIQGGMHEGLQWIDDVRNSTVIHHGFVARMAPVSKQAWIISRNSRLNIKGMVDGRQVQSIDTTDTTVTDARQRLLLTIGGSTGDSSVITADIEADLSDAWLNGSGAGSSFIDAVAACAGATVKLKMNKPTSRSALTMPVLISPTASPRGMQYEYAYDAANDRSRESSAVLTLDDASIEDTALIARWIGVSRDPSLLLILNTKATNPATPRTLAKLPPGAMLNQRLVIVAGTVQGAITLPHGATAGGALYTAGSSRSLTAGGQSVELVLTSTTWRQYPTPSLAS